MGWFLGIVGILVTLGVIAGNAKRRELANAQRRYEESLARLQSDPTNAGLRQQTLALGRAYANLTRNRQGVALFDEVALMNDLNAAAGGTMAVASQGHEHLGNAASSSSAIEDRLHRLSDLRKKGLVSEEEYLTRREAILGEL